MSHSDFRKIPVGISSCLLGHAVRYDGGHKYHSYIERTLGCYFEFRSFCPELEAGMGVPRPAVRLHEGEQGIRCVGVNDPALDVTERLLEVSRRQADWLQGLCGYILKKDSPSCGMQRVKVYRGEIPERDGTGLFAGYLQTCFPELPVEEEGRLGDPNLRENFVQRVFIRHRWLALAGTGLTAHGLTEFHSRHKLIAMSHDQNRARACGRIAAAAGGGNLPELGQAYFSALMECLKTPATRANHVNVLQHIQGYLKRKLDGSDKQELVETIEAYRTGRLPLIVPLTLLRHHFRKQPDPFILASHYLAPHPAELCLLNDI